MNKYEDGDYQIFEGELESRGHWADLPQSEKWWTTYGVIWRMALMGALLFALMFLAAVCVAVAGSPA